MPFRKAGGIQAYLGEKVVKEKEYLSAIVSVDPGIYYGAIPKIERRGWRSMRFADGKEVERLSCCLEAIAQRAQAASACVS